ncbi:MAG: hypothetical protein JSR72_23515 [Proteobacteria bacterium]|nr:hypothetical protein [Pseudomonadota bacterium]
MIVPGAIFALLDFAFSQWFNLTTGAVFGSIGVVWVAFELILGPTAKTRIRTSGASVDLALVSRTRRARKTLAKIDAAIRASRGSVAEATSPATNSEMAKSTAETTSGGPASASATDGAQTNGS